jgi:GH43 family beta-xylosidase
MHSKDMVNWKHLGYALVMPEHKNFWAPCVIYYNGLFYMYYSCMEHASTDVHTEFLRVAVADKPEGPFEYVKTFHSHFSIDPHVVRDEQGEFWIYYTVSRFAGTEDKSGTVNIVDKMTDLLTLAGNPQDVIIPTIKEEIFEKNRFGNGRDWYCVEGSFHLKHRGKEYVMYSGSAFTKEDYFIGYAVKSSDGKWEKFPDARTYHPVIRKSDFVEGTGHHSVALAPNNVDQWVFYHGRNVISDSPEGERRNMRMDPLLWSGDRMWVPGPSDGRQDAPYLPAIHELFDGKDGDGLSGVWRVLSGSWTQDHGDAYQSSNAVHAAVVTSESFDSCIMVVNVRANETTMGEQLGVYALYQDDSNHAAILMDAGRRTLSAFEIVNGIKFSGACVQLDKDIDFAHYHELKILKTGSRCDVYLDGIWKLSAKLHLTTGYAGMFSRYSRARFASFSVTNHVALNESNGQEFAGMLRSPAASQWELVNASLRSASMNVEEASEIFLREELPADFQFSADLDLRLCDQSGSAGVYPTYVSAEQYCSVALHPSSRKVTFKVVKDGKAAEVQSVIELNADFIRYDVHTFIVKRCSGNLIVLFDDRIVYSGPAAFHPDAGHAGLFSYGESGFSRLTLTQL